MTARGRLYRVTNPVMKVWWRATRGLTMGVRVVARDDDGRVALVRHTYVEGWFLPGGGVEKGERAEDAAARELIEEAGAAPLEPLSLWGVYANFATFPGDHVLLYRAGRVAASPRAGDLEIAEVGWFAADALPAGATSATRRSIDEVVFGAPRRRDW